MARHIGPKQKLQRQIGEDLGLKTNALKTARRLATRPGQHGAKGRRKLSNYGVQLKEKQKLKYIYGILEKQLRATYEEASKNPAATGTAMLSFLERRLDNVVYRLGFAPTRAAARQLVNHDHFTVNGKKMNIPSYRVKVGDEGVVEGGVDVQATFRNDAVDLLLILLFLDLCHKFPQIAYLLDLAASCLAAASLLTAPMVRLAPRLVRALERVRWPLVGKPAAWRAPR